MHGIEQFDDRLALVTRGVPVLERLRSGAACGEGPSWIRASGGLLGSDIPADHLIVSNATRDLTVWCDPVGSTRDPVRHAVRDLLLSPRVIVRTQLDGHGHLLGDAPTATAPRWAMT